VRAPHLAGPLDHDHGHRRSLRTHRRSGPERPRLIGPTPPDRKHVLVPTGDLATYRCATNPGQWDGPLPHVYHLEAGMMTRVSYTS